MRVRVRFAKAGKLRYISAIDLGRVWERALRKADLPIAFSEGFSPHPKISFGDALPLGLASTAEFAELTFGGPLDLQDMTDRLNRAFPTGMEVLDAVPSQDGAKRLGKLLQASMWQFDYAEGDEIARAVQDLAPDGPLLVQRERKGELVTVDLRPPLAGIAAVGTSIRAIIHHPGFIPVGDGEESSQGGIAVRADDVHTALGLPFPPSVITRVAQGHVTPRPLEQFSSTPSSPGVVDALRDTVEPLVPDESSARASFDDSRTSPQEHNR